MIQPPDRDDKFVDDLIREDTAIEIDGIVVTKADLV